jgi:thymidylate synthase (FAD)
MRFIREPKVYLLGRQALSEAELQRFLADEGVQGWQTDTSVGAEKLCETAGRVCYMSFGKGRKTNKEYLGHILEVGHGSVLEHAVWNFLITGVSRSFTHELVRHRAGFGYSQLSQRYVDESETDFVEPDCIAEDAELHKLFAASCRQAQDTYVKVTGKLTAKFTQVSDKTLRRKMARQAARCILPNATETKIFVTANARALRNFIELRASPYAETEIRKVAVLLLKLMQREAPNIFGDYRLRALPDGTFAAETKRRKV